MKNTVDLLLGVLYGVIIIFIGVILWSYLFPEESETPEVLGGQQIAVDSLSIEERQEQFSSSQVTLNRNWFLLDGNSDESHSQVQVSFAVNEVQSDILDNAENVEVSYFIEQLDQRGTLVRDGNQFSFQLPLDNFSVGSYSVLTEVVADGEILHQSSTGFTVSHPVYVTWTMDWEGYDVKDTHLEDIATISDSHGIPVTHFFNPRLYTSPNISKNRQEQLTNWVIERRDVHGDSIGLHLHMFPDMLTAAGVVPIEDPIQWGSPLTDGYDIVTLQYSYEDMVQILEWSKVVFEQNGLGTPDMYRAGGWFAGAETLLAVQDTGFSIDSSGREAYTFGEGKLVGPWDLDSTTQPYKPSKEDQNESTGETLDIWEYPNNGADSWMYSAEQMIERFHDNYSEGVSEETKVVTYLSHPEWFHVDKPKIEDLFEYLDQYTYESNSGPVVYITIDEAHQRITNIDN